MILYIVKNSASLDCNHDKHYEKSNQFTKRSTKNTNSSLPLNAFIISFFRYIEISTCTLYFFSIRRVFNHRYNVSNTSHLSKTNVT